MSHPAREGTSQLIQVDTGSGGPRWQFRPDIQGIRAIAVLLVVLYHSGASWVPGGYIGVDVFFVVSGYLITGLLASELESTGRIDLAAFYDRRARRLLPAVFAVTVVALLFSRWLYAPVEQRDVALSALAAAAYVSNFVFAVWSADYLAGGADNNPFLHTWSLAVEEQFYLLWPALLIVAGSGALRSRLNTRLLIAVGVVSLLSLAASVVLTWRSQPWAFFGVWSRAWEFGIGAATFLLTRRGVALRPPTAGWIAIGGALLIVLSALMLDRESSFPGYLAAVPALGTSLLIAAGSAASGGALGQLLASTPMRWLGDLSYSWYLWHWPVLVFGALLYPNAPAWFAYVLLIGSLGLAQASYSLIETPLRFSRQLLPRHGPSLAAMITLSLFGVGMALIVARKADSDMMSAEQRPYTLARADIPIIYSRNCHAGIHDTEHRGCTFGPADAPVRIVLFGDSHAAHWFPAFHELVQRNGWQLLSLTKSTCPSVEVVFAIRQLKRRYTECEQWRHSAIRQIVQMRPTLVVLSNSSGYVRPRDASTAPLVSEAEWQEGTSKVVRELTATGLTVAVFRDTPWVGYDVPACLARAAWRGSRSSDACAFDTETGLAAARNAAAAELAAISGLEGAFRVDLNDTICPEAVCPVATAGAVHFRDGHHLTASFAASLTADLFERLADGLPSIRNSLR